MVKMFPEPFDRFVLIVVGIKPFPLFQVECSFRESIHWVFLLWLHRYSIVVDSSICRLFFLLGFLLLCLLLLGLRLFLLVSLARELCELLGVELCHLGAEDHLPQHSLSIGLV